ncbi:MAG: S26 family signal peptidase, partial [Lachnospiraceae bacterium]|nr:S26 family signal peptidase [Lachnospiraceae bacterium]
MFCITILGVAIIFANSKSTNKSLFGYRYYTILTESMSPKLQVGDIIFVKIVDADEINVGDI